MKKILKSYKKHNAMHDKIESYHFGEYEKIVYRYQLSPNYSIIMIRFQEKMIGVRNKLILKYM